MNKTELIEAIQQVIVPNGQKGITAESLANLLIEMVNATPEGGSGGSGQVVFYAGTMSGNIHEASGLIIADMTPEEKEHNIKMFEAFKTATVKPLINVNFSKLYGDMIGADAGVPLDNLAVTGQPSLAMFIPTELGAFDEEMNFGQDAISLQGLFPMVILADGTMLFDF